MIHFDKFLVTKNSFNERYFVLFLSLYIYDIFQCIQLHKLLLIEIPQTRNEKKKRAPLESVSIATEVNNLESIRE